MMDGFWLLAFILILVFYLLPTIIAYQRDHDSAISIFFVNLLLGWTGIVWLAAVIWASTGTKTIVVSSRDEHFDEGRIKCPDCAELILKEARVCKHCGRKIMEQQEAA